MATRKLIEVALPLDDINANAAREKSIRSGHPSTLHLWWSRKPLAAARAVWFAQLVDDPSSHPDRFPTLEDQAAERARLFELIRSMTNWDNMADDVMWEGLRKEIDHTQLHGVVAYDPFCGGGSLPLEAQRLGLATEASDLNPVAVLVSKALIELAPNFAGRSAIHSEAKLELGGPIGPLSGLSADILHYGAVLRERAFAEVAELYPPASSDAGASEATVMAWLWCRTVRCSNPACSATVPLVNSFDICKTKRRKVSVDPAVGDDGRVSFTIRDGQLSDREGTIARAGATCLACEGFQDREYLRDQAQHGRMGRQLLALVAEGNRRRIYLPPTPEHESAGLEVSTGGWSPAGDLSSKVSNAPGYGVDEIAGLFTPRQLASLNALTEALPGVRADIQAASDTEYSDAITTFLALGIGRLANRSSAHCIWNNQRETIEQTFSANTNIPMSWVFPEANPFSSSSGNFLGQLGYLVKALGAAVPGNPGTVRQSDAVTGPWPSRVVVSTDPPYYDVFRYGELSDFFYVWLRRALSGIYPNLFSTMLSPKSDELFPNDDTGGNQSDVFEKRLENVFDNILTHHIPDVPFTIYYAYREQESSSRSGERASTGWERMLQGLVNSGAMITATWPLRTERGGGLRNLGKAALASSIVIACRPRHSNAPRVSRKEFVQELRAELPASLATMRREAIAPVDLAQASIGPGMAVFSRNAAVLEADGSPMGVRGALVLINQVLDEALEESEGAFDADTRWAVSWYTQFGLGSGDFGTAETLSKAKGATVAGLEAAGILESRGGKVRLLRRDELPDVWDPEIDTRPTVWEATQHLARRLDEGGEEAAAQLLNRLGERTDPARELAYRLFAISERRRDATEALAYNSLVSAWPHIASVSTNLSDGQHKLFS